MGIDPAKFSTCTQAVQIDLTSLSSTRHQLVCRSVDLSASASSGGGGGCWSSSCYSKILLLPNADKHLFGFWCPQLEGETRDMQIEDPQLRFCDRFSGYQHNQFVLPDLWLKITE